MSVAQSGGGGGRLLPEGNALARLVGYIELGNQEQKTGKAKGKIQPNFRLTFALFGNTPSDETFHNEDGSPAIRSSFDMNLSQNEKATAFKLFKKMNAKGVHKHFAQMLNECFIIPIVHSKDKTDPKKVYANLDFDNLRAAIDPITYQPYPVPEITDEKVFKLFLWDTPTQECWDSLYIDGTNDDGKSKNYLQEKILGAVDFPGSPLEQLLGAGGKALPNSLPTVGDDTPAPQGVIPDAPVDTQTETGAVQGMPPADAMNLPTV